MGDAVTLSASAPALEFRPRRIALLANGRRHGVITRLITPWAIGELTHPFVLLSYAEVAQRSRPLFRHYSPSGVATLSVVLNGQLSFEDACGKRGEVGAAGLAWMKAGSVVWHEGGRALREPLRMFQVGVAQQAGLQALAPASECLAPDEVEQDGPVRVVLGQFGQARSRIGHAPADINCLHVRLEDGERFRYDAPDGHRRIWLAVDRGGLELYAGEHVYWEQIALFADSAGVIEAQAAGETSFVLGSART